MNMGHKSNNQQQRFEELRAARDATSAANEEIAEALARHGRPDASTQAVAAPTAPETELKELSIGGNAEEEEAKRKEKELEQAPPAVPALPASTIPTPTSPTQSAEPTKPPEPIMAPIQPRKSIAKDRFSAAFATLKTQAYYEPSATGRGASSQTIRAIAWSPSGHLLATGSTNRTLRIWNPDKPSAKHSTELKGHTGSVTALAWNQKKVEELCSVSSDGTARFWDVRNKTCTAVVGLGSGGEALAVAWSADGGTVIVGRKDDTLVPITVPLEGEPTAGTHLPNPLGCQTNQLLFPNGPSDGPPRNLFLTTGDGAVKIAAWPPITTTKASSSTAGTEMGLHVKYTLSGHTSACLSVAYSPTGRYLASGGSDALISLYDTHDWVQRRTLSGVQGSYRTVGFSWDGSYVCGGSEEGNVIEIAHVETGELVHTIATSAPAACVAWHPKTYWIAYSGDKGEVKIVGVGGAIS